MKKHLVLFFWIISIGSAYCQDVENSRFTTKNSLQIDFGGQGLFYSLNYERVFINSPKFKTAAQIGVAYYPPATGVRDLWIPIGLNEIIGKGKHHFEAGIGFTPIREASRDMENNPMEWYWTTVMSGRIGYRYQKPSGRLILRASFTPILELDAKPDFHPTGGVSIGYSF